MRVRFKFDADLVIEGKDMEEVKSKWLNLPLFSWEALDCGIEYGNTILIEDADTYDDLSNEYNKE